MLNHYSLQWSTIRLLLYSFLNKQSKVSLEKLGCLSHNYLICCSFLASPIRSSDLNLMLKINDLIVVDIGITLIFIALLECFIFKSLICHYSKKFNLCLKENQQQYLAQKYMTHLLSKIASINKEFILFRNWVICYQVW